MNQYDIDGYRKILMMMSSTSTSSTNSQNNLKKDCYDKN